MKSLIQKVMKTRTSHIHSLRKKKEVDYSNYHFLLALYAIRQREGRKEARLPLNDFRNRVVKKESGTVRLKQKFGHYVFVIKKTITSNLFFGKGKPAIIKLHSTSEIG